MNRRNNKTADESQKEEIPSDERPSQPRRKKTFAKQKRDTERSNAFRERAGAKFQDTIDKDIQDTLWFGFEEEHAVLDEFVKQTPRCTDLSISTRGFGFMLQSIFLQLKAKQPTVDLGCTVYQAYRISLLQVEHQLAHAAQSQIQDDPEDDHVTLSLDLWARDAAEKCRTNFRPIVGMVNSIGNFEYEGQRYQATPCLDSTDAEPLGIYFSNLRHIVTSMGSPATPQERRKHFYQRSSLPGAIWGGTHDIRDRDGVVIPGTFPLLTNANDFWPAHYGEEHLRLDIKAFRQMLIMLERKKIKHCSIRCQVAYGGPGSKRLLVANDASSDTMNIRGRDAPPQGDIAYFWADTVLPAPDLVLGSIGLFGEQTHLEEPSNRAHICRRTVCERSWQTTVASLMT